MSKLFLACIIGLALLAASVKAADTPKAAPAVVKNPIEVSGFYAANTEDFEDFQEGVGVGVTYWMSPYVGVGGDLISYLPNGKWYGAAHDANVDEINANLSLRYPLTKIGQGSLGLLGVVGGGNNLEDHEWRLNAGGGLGFTWNRLSVSALAVWVNDFDGTGHAQIRGGIGLSF